MTGQPPLLKPTTRKLVPLAPCHSAAHLPPVTDPSVAVSPHLLLPITPGLHSLPVNPLLLGMGTGLQATL